MKLPNCSRPCADCPFRKDSLKAWLGAERAKEIAQSDTFTCHKTKDPTRLQCAGHMLLMGEKNAFVSLAKAMQTILEKEAKQSWSSGKVILQIGDTEVATIHHSGGNGLNEKEAVEIARQLAEAWNVFLKLR